MKVSHQGEPSIEADSICISSVLELANKVSVLPLGSNLPEIVSVVKIHRTVIVPSGLHVVRKQSQMCANVLQPCPAA